MNHIVDPCPQPPVQHSAPPSECDSDGQGGNPEKRHVVSLDWRNRAAIVDGVSIALSGPEYRFLREIQGREMVAYEIIGAALWPTRRPMRWRHEIQKLASGLRGKLGLRIVAERNVGMRLG